MPPLKAKVFTSATHDLNPPNELQLNTWLAENPQVEIVHLLQSESMAACNENNVVHNLSLTVFYRSP